MENSKRIVENNEVISVDSKCKTLLPHHTYKAEEFIYEIGRKIIENYLIEKWCTKGVPCEVLTPHQGWKKGKVKISLEFCPDEVESPLEDIRQGIDK